jgi:SecD/SecF fusion protein
VRRYHLIVVLVVALLGGVAALALTRSPVLGLDLQGGLEVVLQAEAPPGQEVTEEDLDRSIEIIRNRIDKIGVTEPELRRQPPNQILIELPGLDDPEAAAELIGKTAQLQFYDLEGDMAPPSITPEGEIRPTQFLYELLKDVQDDVEEAGTPTAFYAYGEGGKRLAGPEPTREELLAQLEGGELPEGGEILAVPGNRIVLTCGPPTDLCPGGIGAPDRTYYYLFEYAPTAEEPIPEMTGEDLQLRGTRADFDQSGEQIVTLQFTGEGRDKFHDITRELAQRGEIRTNELASPEPIFQHFAIVLDDEIRSFPYIDFIQNPDGISSQQAQITGLSSQQEAEDLALVLQTGALPLKFEQVALTDVSATLGKDSLNEAVVAAIGGLVAVAIFLLLVYRFLGLVAIAGLAVYGAFLYGAILLFNVTMTLPGFAGLILTIGVAADANIVIFERIKEEVRFGKSVRAAITTGYRKGFATIVDANVVTMITAFILFAVATAGVRGFALMLLIGTALSMFTAVFATRAMLRLLSGFRWFDNPAFMGASAQRVPLWQRIDFVGKRRIWFGISAAVLAAGVLSLAVQGLNLGIDFEGGSQVRFDTAQPVTVDRVRQAASGVVPASAVVQGRGEEQGGRFTSFQIRTESLDQEERQQLRTVLADEVGLEGEPSVNVVSESFSGQILRQAIIAIFVSLVLIFLYIWFRFGLKFGVPVMVALLHDVFITLGLYSLLQREVTTSTVAAVLTILGYSIYDTIIIFDRVRENVPLMKRSSFAAIANQSLWETLRRSLATSFITVLPIISLLIFGGDTLKDFAFALLIGIISGAYSTVFIATPVLSMLKEREPEWRERRGVVVPEEKLLDVDPAAAAAVSTPAEKLAARIATRGQATRSKRRRARGTPAQASAAAPPAAKAEPQPVAPEELVEEQVAAVDEPVAAEPAGAVEPEPDAEPQTVAEPEPVGSGTDKAADAAARREARRQRRRTRPHGRAR